MERLKEHSEFDRCCMGSEVQAGSEAFLEDSGDRVVSLARIHEGNSFPTPDDLVQYLLA